MKGSSSSLLSQGMEPQLQDKGVMVITYMETSALLAQRVAQRSQMSGLDSAFTLPPASQPHLPVDSVPLGAHLVVCPW